MAAEIAGLDETTSLNALQEIHSRSLAEELDRDDRRYRVHALVREATGTTDVLRKKQAELVHREFEEWENNWHQREKDMADWQVAFTWALEQPGAEAWKIACCLARNAHLLTHRLGRLPESYEICQRMTREADGRGDKSESGEWYGRQGLILRAWGRFEETLALHKKQEAICQELGDKDGLRFCYGSQALSLFYLGQLKAAMELYKKEEAICEELGNKIGLASSYGNQALVLQSLGRPEEAMVLHKKQEKICQELGHKNCLQHCYGNQASILLSWSRLEEVMALLKKKESICLELGHKGSLANCYWSWGLTARAQGDFQTAREKLEQALALYTELGMPQEIKAVQVALYKTNSYAQPN